MKNYILILILTGISGFAFAEMDVCSFIEKPFPVGVKLTASQVSEYHTRLIKECDLSKKFKELQQKARNKYGIELTQISLYQAMRFIQRADYERAATYNIPVPKIYQRYQKNYSLVPELQTSEIWDDFQFGIVSLEPIKALLLGGQALTLEQLKQIHANFYHFSDESGDFGGTPNPGVLKRADTTDIEWFKIKPQDVKQILKIVEVMNESYAKLGLISGFDETLNPYVNQILSVRPLENNEFGVFRGDAQSVEDHVVRILSFLNQGLMQSLKGQPIVMGGQLFTPGQLAYLGQQYYIQTHPFSDGNGRTSRFIQELILTSFGMPHGSSGDLMRIDATTSNDEYYATAISKNHDELEEVKYCLDQAYSSLPYQQRKKVKDFDQSLLEYKCRVIN